jgi:hypothetical protein
VPGQHREEVRDLFGVPQSDAEHQRVPRQHRLLERVVDDDAADLATPVDVTVDDLEQRRAEVVEHAAQAGVRPEVHRLEHHPKLGALRSA